MNGENTSQEEILDEVRKLKSVVATLSEAVRSQENRLSGLEGFLASSSVSRGQADTAPIHPEESAPLPPPPPRYSERSDSSDIVEERKKSLGATFTEWFKVDWPMKVGALLIFLGFGWAIPVVIFDAIGPVGRIALGILVGIGILTGGYLRMRASHNQGGVLLGLGTATTLLTVFAAREIYDFFNPFLAVVFMSMVVVFTAYSSLVYRSRAIAFMSLIAGGLVPVLTVGKSDFLGLFLYLFFLSAGTLWVVRLTAWRTLVAAAITIVALHSFPFIVGLGSPERFEALLVAFSFSALFFVTGLLGILKDRAVAKEDLFVMALNGFLLLGWIHSFVSATFQSFSAILAAVLFGVGAFLVYRASGIASPVYLYAGNAVVFFVAATAYELSGAVFIIALALEMGLIISGSFLFLRNAATSKKLGWLMVFPVFASMESVGDYARVLRYDSMARTSMGTSWYDSGVFTADFFAILTVALVVSSLAYLYRIAESSEGRRGGISGSRLFMALSTLYGLFLVWFGFKRAIDDPDTAAMFALTVYTLFGMALYMKGRFSEVREMQRFGSIILVFVAVRLLLIDMEVETRIVTFFVIGALFMSIAFFGRKKKDPFPPTAGGAVVGAMLLCSLSLVSPVSAKDVVSDDLPLAAFEYVESVALPGLKTPSVVEIPVNDPVFRNGNFAVYEETTGIFQPSAYRSVDRSVPVRATADSGEESAQYLVDRNFQTTVSFPVRDDGEEAVAEIRVSAEKPLALSGFTLELDRFVSLPRSAEVFLLDGGQRKVMLAKTGVSGRTIRFPRETGIEWLIRLSYVQPLRIAELSFFDENAPTTEREAIRFLARPGESYRIYFGADRPVSAKTGESPDLLDNRDIVMVPAGVTQRNPAYVPADTDGDGVRDILDNCVSVPNQDQADETGNGRGDVCDDYDKDGVANETDNCPSHPNRNQADTDGDGKGDVCDGEESRITEKYVWLPWVAMVAAGFVVAGLFAATIRRERNKN